MGSDMAMFVYHRGASYDKDPRLQRGKAPLWFVVFDSLRGLSMSDPCLVSLTCCRREVAWIQLPNLQFKESLCALLRQASTSRHSLLMEQRRLSQKETELARLRERELAINASHVEETRCPSSAESSSEEEPFGSTVVLDWPLSRSEKHLRLVNALDRQRIAEVASERRKRVGTSTRRRFSAPASSCCGSAQ
eukprot:symbB.v1.2.017423.t1/scaffold1359.1/size123592/8